MSDVAVVSNALVIPRPTDVVDVYGLCQSIEQRIAEVDDIATLKDAQAKLGAIAEYVGRTSKDGIAQLQATMRRLETRCGEVLGPASTDHGNQHTSRPSPAGDEQLSKHERTEFRSMAQHPDIVEEVIAESTDEQPPSRQKILDRIRSKKIDAMLPPTMAQRRAAVEAMAEQGNTSRQIAARLGISLDGFRQWRQKNPVEIPADAVVGKARGFDSNTIVSGIVATVDGVGMMLDQIDYGSLDTTEFEHWVSVLDDSIRSLTTLRKNLKELSQ